MTTKQSTGLAYVGTKTTVELSSVLAKPALRDVLQTIKLTWKDVFGERSTVVRQKRRVFAAGCRKRVLGAGAVACAAAGAAAAPCWGVDIPHFMHQRAKPPSK